jgi:RNA polymerase sigma-70 factor, ECF subfamily
MDAPQNPSIAELLVRAQRDGPQELDRLFQRCRSYLVIVARSQVESWLQAKVDASDIVQETLIEAYRDFASFQGASEGEWLEWLRRILHNNAANFVRRYRGTAKRQARREQPIGSPGGSSAAYGAAEPVDGGESPSQHLLRAERALQLADALARMAPDHREVIVLRNLQRLPFQDVAGRMDRSLPAVQMLWKRAILKLREELSGLRDESRDQPP